MGLLYEHRFAVLIKYNHLAAELSGKCITKLAAHFGRGNGGGGKGRGGNENNEMR